MTPSPGLPTRIPLTLALLFFAGLAGCGPREQDAATDSGTAEARPATTVSSEETPPAEESTTESFVDSLESAKKHLAAGQFDTAAASLLRAHPENASITPDQAASYRETLGQAMSAAAAAAEKGDPKGEAALQMLRATRRR